MPPRIQYPQPSLRVLRWLTDAGPDVPAQVRGVLIGELLSSPGAVVMGCVNGLLVNVAGLFLHYTTWFVAFAVLEVICGVWRTVVIRAALRARKAGLPVPIDTALVMSGIWCALQGAMAFTSMRTGNPTLQILSATMTMGVIGPICARNYPAPRLAFLLVCLIDLPFAAGGVMSYNPWLLILPLMTPPFLYGCAQIIQSCQKVAVTALTGELDSEHRARHDPLTRLRNRLGFSDAVKAALKTGDGQFVLMCLDLDGFKRVNDTLGHHAGDLLLQDVARRLDLCMRPGDALFRVGGDEFVVLAPGLPAALAGSFAERLIDTVSSEPYRFEGMPLVRVGMSAGYACAPDDGADAEDLHRKADVALYASKAAGKGMQRRFGLQLAA